MIKNENIDSLLSFAFYIYSLFSANLCFHAIEYFVFIVFDEAGWRSSYALFYTFWSPWLNVMECKDERDILFKLYKQYSIIPRKKEPKFAYL